MANNVNSKIIKKINNSEYDDSIKSFLKDILILEYNMKDQKTFTKIDIKRFDDAIRKYASNYGDRCK